MAHGEFNLSQGIENFDIDVAEGAAGNDEPNDEGANEEGNANTTITRGDNQSCSLGVRKHLEKSRRVMVGAPNLSIRKVQL